MADEFVIRASDKLILAEHSFQTAAGDWLVFFTDHSTLSESIFYHRISATGALLTSEAIPLEYKVTDQRLVNVIPASDGNFIVAWQEVSNNGHLYMQKLNSDCQSLWVSGGVKCVDSLSDHRRSKMIANNVGGLIVAYQEEYRETPICAQNFDSQGNKLWGEEDIVLVGSGVRSAIGDIVPYPQGGFLLRFWSYSGYYQTCEVWHYSASGALVDDNSLVPTDIFFKGLSGIIGPVNGEYLIFGDYDSMIQINKVSADGELLLDQLLNYHGGQLLDIKLLSDGKVAIVINYGSFDGNTETIRLYLLSADLEPLWNVEEQSPRYQRCGVSVCPDGKFLLTWGHTAQLYDASGTRLFSEPQVITGDSGHEMLALPTDDTAIFLWSYIYNTRQRIKLQAMNMDGSLIHLPNGIILEEIEAGGCPDGYYAKGLNYCFALGDRFISFWTDTRLDGSYYYQLFDQDMQPLLETNGRSAQSGGVDAYNLLQIHVRDNNRLHFIYRTGYDYKIYLQAIDYDGNLCYGGNGIEIELPDNVTGNVEHVTYVFWTVNVGSRSNKIMGQRYVNGQAQWEANGKLLLPNVSNHKYTLLGFKNGFLVYSDCLKGYQEEGPAHLKALKFDTYGMVAWVGGDYTILLSSEPIYPGKSLYGKGMMGEDLCLIVRRASEESIHSYILQKISPQGDRLWGDAGISFEDCGLLKHSVFRDNAVSLLTLGDGGYTFHSVNSMGNIVTQYGGISIIPAAYAPKEVDFATFEDGSMICVFSNDHESNSDIYIRRIDADGTPTDSAPVVLCNARNIQSQPRIATYSNKAFITWKDHRAGVGITGLWGNTVRSSTPNDDALQTPIQQAQIIGNYPNPFNPTTTISFHIATAGVVKLDIYNVRGQYVNTLVHEPKTRGKHQVVWNGTDHDGQGVASGVYLVRLCSNDKNSSTHKMLLMK
jgi:hypothetical protein